MESFSMLFFKKIDNHIPDSAVLSGHSVPVPAFDKFRLFLRRIELFLHFLELSLIFRQILHGILCIIRVVTLAFFKMEGDIFLAFKTGHQGIVMSLHAQLIIGRIGGGGGNCAVTAGDG